MENRIVTLPSKKIREVARVAMEGKWIQLALFFFLYMLINDGVSLILDLFFTSTTVLPAEDPLTGEAMVLTTSYGSSIYGFLVSGPLTWGLSKYMLDFFRNKKTETMTLVEGFSHFGRAFGLAFLIGVKIVLWSLLFIIPGIIAAYRYSQAFYVMIDHPEYTLNQCIKESSRLMNGNKFKFFCLEMSFIGWYMLANITAIFAPAADSVFGVILVLIFCIPTIFVDAYSHVAMTVFYDLACDNLVIMEDDEPLPLESNDSNEPM